MDKRTLAIALATAGICAVILALWVNTYGPGCLGQGAAPAPAASDPSHTYAVPSPPRGYTLVSPTPGTIWNITPQTMVTLMAQGHIAFCRSKEAALGFEIGATVLLGLAVITWTRRTAAV